MASVTELRRLEALWSLDVLDVPAHPKFDTMVQVMQRLVGLLAKEGTQRGGVHRAGTYDVDANARSLDLRHPAPHHRAQRRLGAAVDAEARTWLD